MKLSSQFMNDFSFLFFLNSILFGVGLAMDAFSVSLGNGLSKPDMKRKQMVGIAGTFSGFQIAMPLIGWICVHTIATIFVSFQKFIPWIALVLLLYIGGKMLWEGIRGKEDTETGAEIGFWTLMLQGIATSIDALSVGFTIADLSFFMALIEALIIGVVTFFICIGGLCIGRKFGTRLAGKATILGGVILVGIGIEIFVSSFF